MYYLEPKEDGTTSAIKLVLAIISKEFSAPSTYKAAPIPTVRVSFGIQYDVKIQLFALISKKPNYTMKCEYSWCSVSCISLDISNTNS